MLLFASAQPRSDERMQLTAQAVGCLAWTANQPRSGGRRFKMSLADAFAAALAKERRVELVTGDPEFTPLEREIKVHWLK